VTSRLRRPVNDTSTGKVISRLCTLPCYRRARSDRAHTPVWTESQPPAACTVHVVVYMYAVTVVTALGVLDYRHRFSAMRETALQSSPEIDSLHVTTFRRTHDLHQFVVRFTSIDIRHPQAEPYFRLSQHSFCCQQAGRRARGTLRFIYRLALSLSSLVALGGATRQAVPHLLDQDQPYVASARRRRLPSQLSASTLYRPDAWSALDVDGLVQLYNDENTAALRLIPIRTMRCRRRPSDPWFDDECRTAKRHFRRLERTASAAQRTDDTDAAATATALWTAQRRSY